MAVTLQLYAAGDVDYVSKLNSNATVIEGELNSLAAQVLASFGEGAQLILDTYDRDGVVGTASYVLDIGAYAGAALIDIGRRPTPVPAFGDPTESVAWGTFSGVKRRVTQSTDVTLNAAAITTGLPKDIFVVIGADGTAAFEETDSLPNLIYVYTMCWDGFQLTDFRRRAPILPGYSLIQSIAAAPTQLQVSDSDTDWLQDLVAATEVSVPGAKEDNEILLDGGVEVLGFFVHAMKSGNDGWNAPFPSSNPDDAIVKMKVTSEGVDWTLAPMEIDAGAAPDVVYQKLNIGVVGLDRFVTVTRRFRLERTALGANITSARGFTWGLFVRPILGIAIPKDTTKVLQV